VKQSHFSKKISLLFFQKELNFFFYLFHLNNGLVKVFLTSRFQVEVGKICFPGMQILEQI